MFLPTNTSLSSSSSACIKLVGLACNKLVGLACIKLVGLACIKLVGLACIKLVGLACIKLVGLACIKLVGLACIKRLRRSSSVKASINCSLACSSCRLDIELPYAQDEINVLLPPPVQAKAHICADDYGASRDSVPAALSFQTLSPELLGGTVAVALRAVHATKHIGC